MHKKICFLLILVGLLLAGCAGGQQGGGSGAVSAVERYYQALVERDDAAFAQTTCAEWEEQALLEFDSFQGVDIALDDAFSCAETGTEGEATLVTCDGTIEATYGNEKMEFPLAERVHRVQNAGGDWRVCGY